MQKRLTRSRRVRQSWLDKYFEYPCCRSVKEREASQVQTIDNMVLGMSFSDTSSIWSPSCHRVPSTLPNPRAGPTPPPFQGWQNSPVLKTKDCHEYHLRSHLRQPELVCCPKVDMLPTRLVQVWSDHQPEILNSTKSKIQSDVNE